CSPSGKMLAPNKYTVRLNPEDIRAFEPYRETLERELADYLCALADKRALIMLGRPAIHLEADEIVPRGSISVKASLEDQVTHDQTMAFTAPIPAQEERPPAPGARLRLGDRVIPLEGPFVTIGRSLDNDVILESEDVSRHHAQIKWRQGVYVLTDLGSVNGTWVNDQPVRHEWVLHHGDRIRFAHVEVIFELPEAWPKARSRS
ncbi:MAG: DUF3662 domain-containing protein, partial [Ardenticatenia bacterium]|nr:DUF3662 domain-containing protein [Ardenticatenia bacterium]